MDKKETIVSGIRSTGQLHLGNYFGAVKQFIKIQHQYPCYFFIADYHSLTTHPNAATLNQHTKQVLAEYLACGLDPEAATLYIQSQVPEVLELYLFFNMNAYLGELERCTSFKDKARKQPDNVNAGLLTYPTLMAADILIHKGTKVPVGKDQEQHLEMARNFANRFNRMYEKEVFPEPYAFNFDENLVKIPGLDGSGKMGKSEGQQNAVFLYDDPKTIKKKIMRAVTDSGPEQPNQSKPEAIENLFTLTKFLSGQETYDYFNEAYNNCSIRYGDLKKQLAADTITFLAPFREKIDHYLNDTKKLNEVAELGAEKARQSARTTIAEAREVIGFKSF